MDAVDATDVVFVMRVDEVVDLFASFDAGINELDAVLPNHGVVLGTMDDKKTAIEVLGLGQEGVVGVTLGVLLWGVHIPLAIHDLVPFPVNDRATSATHFKDFGMSQFHRDGHETAKAPTLNTHTVFIDIG